MHGTQFAGVARIRVRITERQGARYLSTVNSGGGFGASSLRPHIGLGKASVIDELEILSARGTPGDPRAQANLGAMHALGTA
jgi:hypothetical protein